MALEESHTLAFVSLGSLASPAEENPDFPIGPNAVKVDFVEGRTYTIYCKLPGHRSSGMEATVTVGPPDSQMNTVSPTIPASATGR